MIVKINKYPFYFQYCLILILIFCGSCNMKKNSEKGKNVSFKTNKKVKFTKNICALTKKDSISNLVLNSKIKVLVLVNLDCDACTFELEEWEDMIQKKILGNVDFIFIAFGKLDTKLAKKYIINVMKFKESIFYDEGHIFLKENNLHKISQVFLLNENNEILIENCNPIHSSIDKKKFLDSIACHYSPH